MEKSRDPHSGGLGYTSPLVRGIVPQRGKDSHRCDDDHEGKIWLRGKVGHPPSLTDIPECNNLLH
jgi:hypothetical protein